MATPECGKAADIDTDVLICGTGPAGASLASFLAYHGISGLCIERESSTSITPRAHYTNMATWECLRDIGLEQELANVSSPIEKAKFYRFCTTLADEELSRAFAFGNDPRRHGDYWGASPCAASDLPQNRMEPILVKYASQNGFKIRFDTELVSFKENPRSEIIESVLKDRLTGRDLTVRSKYLCGSDGASGKIAQDLQLPFRDEGTGGLALNVWFDADLSHLMEHSNGLLHICTRPDRPQPPWGLIGICRFVIPFNQWIMVLLADPSLPEISATDSEIMARTRELVGDETVPMTLKRISKWTINECYALQYSKGNVFCLGDAVHRHPPFNGLGGNTCIQDSYNLAWKLAYVLRGRAPPALLRSFDAERAPIGKYIVTRANDSSRLHRALHAVLGVMEPAIERRQQVLAEFKEDSERGAARRAEFRSIIHALNLERHALGAEMNQHYRSSAVYADDETEAPPAAGNDDDYALRYIQATCPGFRLPHAWLGVAQPPGRKLPPVSTHDLAGKGRFTLFTGIGGGEVWRAPAARVAERFGVEVAVFTIGWGQEYADSFFEWSEKRGVGEKGAVLVRPDRTVAWRAEGAVVPEGECVRKLEVVLGRVLGVADVGSEGKDDRVEGLGNGFEVV